MGKVLSKLYLLLGFILSVLICPFLLLNKRGAVRLKERYGVWGVPPGEYVWFHGASVGEVGSLLPVIESYKKKNPGVQILLTATTFTGLEKGEGIADQVRLLPFDHPIWINRALSGLKIVKFIFGETEIWPSLLSYLGKREVPIYLVNGVVSDFSIRYYSILGALFSEALGHVKRIGSSSELHTERFYQIGAKEDQVVTTGNAKYDRPPSVTSLNQAEEIKKELVGDSEKPICIVGSLRKGEEDIWFDLIKELEVIEAGVHIVVVPRHLEDLPLFMGKINARSLSSRRLSDDKVEGEDNGLSLLIVDQMGRLEPLYSVADIAFIGGSLVEGYGGHNPLEAAVYGTPIMMGPYYQNARQVVEIMGQQNGYLPVRSTEDILEILKKMVADKGCYAEVGERGREVWNQFSGATDKILHLIEA